MKTISQLGFMVLFLFSAVGSLNAQLPPNHPWFKSYTWPDGTQTILSEIADAKTLLGSKYYGRYKFHLETMNCIEANNMLRLAFKDHYPQFAKMITEDRDGDAEWTYSFVGRKYRDLHFCYIVMGIDIVNSFDRVE